MKVMIADDHPLYVEGLRNLLRHDFHIVGSVGDGRGAVKAARDKKPDVILMDIDMPTMDGIEATKLIKERIPETEIIILTAFREKEKLFRAIRAGAAGYLLKDLDGDEIIEGLKELKRGKNPFSPGMSEQLLHEFRSGNGRDDQRESGLNGELSDRQIEILELVARGLTYREIGEELFISERTVKYHMENIKARLDLRSREQVIAWAWEKGIPN